MGSERADAECVTELTLTNARLGVDAVLTYSSAQSQLGGGLVALFATDYSQEGLTALGRHPEVAPGGNLVWIDLGDPLNPEQFAPLSAGDRLEVDSADSAPITASHWTDTRFDGLFSERAGEVIVRERGDTICVDVRLMSGEFSVVGTISADLVDAA